MPRKKKTRGEKVAPSSGAARALDQAKQAFQALENAKRVLDAELLRWREMKWCRIPADVRLIVMPYLTAGDMCNLDTAMSDKEAREDLMKAYIGLRSPALDRYAHYRVSDGGKCMGVAWVQKRSIDLRNFRLEFWGYKRFQGDVLGWLVCQKHQDVATYFATRCDVRDDADIQGSSTLMLASENGYLEIVQALLGREGTDVNKGECGLGREGNTALHYAAREGHIEVARALLQAGANARKDNILGQTPLHWASKKGHIEIVRALLEAGAGADVRKVDHYCTSPIYHACRGKHFEVFRALVEAGGDVNELDSVGRTALHHASRWGLTEGVRYLCVERGADVNKSSTGGDGNTALTLASLNGKVEVARVLLEAGADVNKRTTGGDGNTPLTLASENGRVEVVRVLLEAGADVNKSNDDGNTALHVAARGGHIEVARALLQAGANARESNDGGDTALHLASEKGCIEIVRALLEAGAGEDVRKRDNIGLSPISYACDGKHFEVFRALVEAGGDVNELDSVGHTALHWASVFGLTEGVRYLCAERGADVNKSTTGEDGHTPLTAASWIGRVEAVRVLLEAGADVNKSTTGEDGHTPLTAASKTGKIEVVRVLLEAGADVNKSATGGDGDTALTLATQCGKVEAVRVLLEAGADVNKSATGGECWTPLTLASTRGEVEMVRVLLEAGADVNKSAGKTCWTSLVLASMRGEVEVAKVLLEAGVDVTERNSHRMIFFLALKAYDGDTEQVKQNKAQIAALFREAGAQEPKQLSVNTH
jgi:ankyrin repeat protein